MGDRPWPAGLDRTDREWLELLFQGELTAPPDWYAASLENDEGTWARVAPDLHPPTRRHLIRVLMGIAADGMSRWFPAEPGQSAVDEALRIVTAESVRIRGDG